MTGDGEEGRGPGRPEIGRPVNVRLGDELLARVDAIAAARGRSRADIVRGLVEQALGRRYTGTECSERTLPRQEG